MSRDGQQALSARDLCGPLVLFVAVYLITYRGWPEVRIGILSLVLNVLMLVLQTPAGDLLDKTRFKRSITAVATFVAAVTTVSVSLRT